MAEAKIFRVIREQRRGIEQSELAMLRKLADNWLPVKKYLEQQIKDMTAAIEKQMVEGKPVWASYRYSLDRYKKMLAEAEAAIKRYNDATARIITGEEADAVRIGSENAETLLGIIDATKPDEALWTRINQRQVRIMTGMLSPDSPLSKLLAKSWPELKDKIESILMIGIGTGQGAEWIARQLESAIDIPYRRAILIARTEVNRAYREANLETMRASESVIGYRRMCYPPTACFACLMMDGDFYEKGEPFSDHPNGKCSLVPVTKHFDPINDPTWERGQKWFSRQDEGTQRKIMGAGRFDLWMNYGVNPRDMVYIKDNPLWGGSPTIKTVESLKMSANYSLSGKLFNTKPANQKISENGEVINPMFPIDYYRMKSALEQQGIDVWAATEGDDLRYMLAIGAEGTYSNGRITHIGSLPSRGTFFEEIIHMQQARDYGELDSTDSIELYAREIEANQKLLRYNKAYRLDDTDVADIERNLKSWEKKFKKATGMDYDDSNYRTNH